MPRPGSLDSAVRSAESSSPGECSIDGTAIATYSALQSSLLRRVGAGMGEQPAREAEKTLADVQRLRQYARTQAHGGAWVPAGLVAALILASIVLYRYPFQSRQQGAYLIEYPAWAGLPDVQRDVVASYVFWFAGLALLFAVTGVWYRMRARKHGMTVNWWLFAAAGTAALVLLVVLAAVPARTAMVDPAFAEMGVPSPPYQGAGFLTPLLAVAVAVLALGWIERSRGLMVSGLWITAITLWQSAYGDDLGAIPGWFASLLGGFQEPALGGQVTVLGLDRAGPTLILIAAPLLVFAVVGAIRAMRAGQ